MSPATEEPRCRLFLVAPSSSELDRLALCLNVALEFGDVGCVRVDGSGEEAAVRRQVATILPMARAKGVPVILSHRADLAAATSADGVEIYGEASEIAVARQLLGAEAVIGGFAGQSRHLAIELAEAGADYVALTGTFDGEATASWWAEIAVVAGVAADPVGPDDAAELARRGVDFVVPDPTMWESPEAARRILSDYAALLERQPR